METTETVSFTRMQDGTAEDWQLIDTLEESYIAGLPERILEAMEKLNDSFGGYKVTRYTHSLQVATRALRDGKDEEYVVTALIHDIGDDLAPYTHDEMAATMLKPFVRDELVWMVKHHGAFQQYYFAEAPGSDPNARDRWKEHPAYDLTVEFCEKYDQTSFDPDYDTLPISEFEPMVKRIFAEPRYQERG